MKNSFLTQKKLLVNRKAHGDIGKAAILAGVKLVVFYKWVKAEVCWPTVDIRNYNALKSVIDDRERKLQEITNPTNNSLDDKSILRMILKKPTGCVFCDSGKLRDPNKEHDTDCGFYAAKQAVTKANTDFFDDKYFSDSVFKLRKNCGLSLRDMAFHVGISAATLNRIESGKAPDIESFYKICLWAEFDHIKDFAKKQ